jgi:hypothetical protein
LRRARETRRAVERVEVVADVCAVSVFGDWEFVDMEAFLSRLASLVHLSLASILSLSISTLLLPKRGEGTQEEKEKKKTTY